MYCGGYQGLLNAKICYAGKASRYLNNSSPFQLSAVYLNGEDAILTML